MAARGSRLRATPAQLHDALGACTELNPVYRRLVKMTIEGLQFVEQQIRQLEPEIASLLQRHQDAVERLGGDSAQQIIAEMGAKAATFQTLGKQAQAVSIEPNHFDQITSAASEDEDMTREGVLTTSHIRYAGGDPYLRSSAEIDHLRKLSMIDLNSTGSAPLSTLIMALPENSM
jgi:hypothetical protein